MLNTLITVVVTVLMLGFLVLIHEGGHYLVARACGVGIMEFAIGMGPVIYRKKGKYNDFTIRLLPIGGFVSMIGEDDQTEIPEEHQGKPSLNEKKVWQKMLIVLA
ncbi:MAG: site-2 protease family protein, partial [Clostridia bacterium]|nr:site-2 protease family protein [Clostridia bacterium]